MQWKILQALLYEMDSHGVYKERYAFRVYNKKKYIYMLFI